MPLRLPPYEPIPAADSNTELIEVPAAGLHPTQWCVGLAEIWSREQDFSAETRQERLDYLRAKPVPLVRSASGAMWMLDRHHRLRGLLGVDPDATTWGYVIQELVTADRRSVLIFSNARVGCICTMAGGSVRNQPWNFPSPCWSLRMILTAAWCGN